MTRVSSSEAARVSWSRILSAVVALLAVVAPASPALATTGAPTQVARAVEDGVAVELVQLAPTVARPGDTQTVTVRVMNGTSAPLTGATADLAVGWAPVTSRSELAAWGDSETAVTAGTPQERESVPDVAAGGSAQITFELRVDALQLGDDAVWGPRLMSVAVTDRDGAPLDTLRTYLLFDPTADDTRDGGPPAAVRLSVLAPVTGPPLDPADPAAYATTVATRTVAGGSLSRVLDTARGSAGEPTVSLAVDPALVAAAAGSGDPGAAGWADQLTGPGSTGAGAPDVVTLPPLDPDLAAIAHAGISARAATAATSTLPASLDGWEMPEAWSTTLAWPVRTPDLQTVSTARHIGADHVLVPGGLVPTTLVAASGLATVDTAAGEVSAVVADDQLSSVLLSGTGAKGADAVTPAETSQRLLADLAILATDAAASASTVHLVAAMPRNWSPDVAATRETLETLEASGWVDVAPLSELLAQPVVDVPRTQLERSSRGRGELRASTVRDLATARRAAESLATMAADRDAFVGDVEVALAAPLSVSFRSARPERDAAAQFALERAGELSRGLSVVPRGDLTLVSAALDVPVRIRNDHSTDVTVTVVLRPDDPRLTVDEKPTVVVPAGQSADVPVHVRAIGSGDVKVAVDVLAPSGAVAADPSVFSVRVRAGWETVGTAVVAGAVGLLFVAGIWRTVRRGRSPRRTTGEYVAESTATGPTPHITIPERKS